MTRAAHFLLALSLVGGCDKKDETKSDDGDGGGDGAPAAVGGKGDSAPRSKKRAQVRGKLKLPDAVPASAAGVLAVRVPKTMFDSFVGVDPMGVLGEDVDTLKKELDGYFKDRLGITFTDAETIVAFVDDKGSFGVVLIGVEGEPKGEKVGTEFGVDVFKFADEELRVAAKGDLLIMGNEDTVKAALEANDDDDKALNETDLGELVEDESDGASVVVAVDVARAPKDLRRQLPPQLSVDRALMSLGNDGLRVLLEGDEKVLAELSGLMAAGMTEVISEIERQKRRAMGAEDADEVVEGAFAIIGLHYMRRVQKAIVPKIDGNRLTIEVPMVTGDPAVLASIAGMGAAIAIPATVKYARRAKTAEARVQLAKMFDAASAFFNEEHVSRGAIGILGGPPPAATAAHKCPNNGDLEGEAGITPPLSVDCNDGPGGRCVPSVGGGGPGYYDMSMWTDNDVWNGLNFQQEQAHYFHYNFKWKNSDTGFGDCQFTTQAFADLDGDGVYSTYERSGAADVHGVNAAAGLYIDKETE